MRLDQLVLLLLMGCRQKATLDVALQGYRKKEGKREEREDFGKVLD